MTLFIIILFLFNLFGYRIVVGYMQQRATEQLTSRIDNNLYNEAQLIEFKVPFYVPYLNNWLNYQRYDGEVEVKGVLYTCVKRKVINDTLYLLCLPNTKKMHLETVKNNLFQISNGLIQNSNAKKPSNSQPSISFKNIQGEYEDYSFKINTNSSIKKIIEFKLIKCLGNLLSTPHTSPGQPPELALS